MAETAEKITTDPDGTWRMDAAAFIPTPAGHVTINGVSYPVYSFLDVPVMDSLKVARLGADIRSTESYDESMERSIEQIMLLNAPGQPRLEREHFNRLSPSQIITLTVLASSIAQVPQKAAAEVSSESSESPSPSPASADSSGGDSETSSA